MEGTCTILGAVLVLRVSGIVITLAFSGENAAVTVKDWRKLGGDTEMV